MNDDTISRKAAINSVCKYCEYYYNENLIQTIKDLPSAQPEKHTETHACDLISKADLFNRLANVHELGEVYAVIQFMPAVESGKRGTWKAAYLDHEAFGERPRIFYCSECNQCIAYPVNFCPSCGADMRGKNG